MTKKKKKEENTSSGTPKKSHGKERLSSMIESMQKRGSPVNAHKVATKYFDSFRKERNIPDDAGPISPLKDSPTPVGAGEDSTVTTAVESIPEKKTPEKKAVIKERKSADDQGGLYDTLSPSEAKVYRAMSDLCTQKKTDSHRFGLKMLRELTGLSDKTVRKSIHSLEDKMCITVLEPSLGIYGRKIRVLSPKEVFEMRLKRGIEIDPTTKMIVRGVGISGKDKNTAVTTAVDNKVGSTKDTAIPTPLDTAVPTAVDKMRRILAPTEESVKAVYRKYTGNSWGAEEGKFFKSISATDMAVIETAIILSSLKGEGGIKSLSDISEVLRELGGKVPDGYLTELRDVWRKVKSVK